MKIALGRLGWPPAVFWASTPHELWAGLDGWIEANCVQKDKGPLSDDDLLALEDMKRRFPDDKPGNRHKSNKKKKNLTPALARSLFGTNGAGLVV